MNKAIFLLLFTGLIINHSNGQQSIKPNEFKIGIFSSKFKTQNIGGCDIPFTDPLDANGNKTSTLNVLSEDGFNIFETYEPNEWVSESALRNKILLAGKNGMKIELSAGHYYKPSVDAGGNYLGYGTNVYDNCGNSISTCNVPAQTIAIGKAYSNFFRADISNFVINTYKLSPYEHNGCKGCRSL